MLENLLRLAKEEGGKAFVMNQTTGEVFCVMPLETYREMKRGVNRHERHELNTNDAKVLPTENIQNIASLTEEELLRKINREIAIWRDQQKDKAKIILPTREDRNGVPSYASSYAKASEDKKATDDRTEVKKIAKDFPKIENTPSLQTASIAKAPILETEEEFFLEMA